MYSRVRLGQSPVEVAPLGVGCWAWGDKRYWRYEIAELDSVSQRWRRAG